MGERRNGKRQRGRRKSKAGRKRKIPKRAAIFRMAAAAAGVADEGEKVFLQSSYSAWIDDPFAIKSLSRRLNSATFRLHTADAAAISFRILHNNFFFLYKYKYIKESKNNKNSILYDKEILCNLIHF